MIKKIIIFYKIFLFFILKNKFKIRVSFKNIVHVCLCLGIHEIIARQDICIANTYAHKQVPVKTTI